MVVKGIVCKKNVAHRRMTSKIDKPRFIILGGALEYQRVSNQLSSVDTLLQQVLHKIQLLEIDNYILNMHFLLGVLHCNKFPLDLIFDYLSSDRPSQR